jgi:hypothetical protein
MALDQDQQRAVIDWYNLHVKKCPICSFEGILIESVNVMPEVGPSGPIQGWGFGAVPIVCKSCGYTILVSATALKFVPASQPPTRIA